MLILVVSCKPKVVSETNQTQTVQNVIVDDKTVVSKSETTPVENNEDSNNNENVENEVKNTEDGVKNNDVINIIESNDDAVLSKPANVKPMDPEIQKLVDKARKVNKFSYRVRLQDANPQKFYDIFVSDNKIKIFIPDQQIYKDFDFVDSIYLDTNTKDAYAYCESYFCKNPNTKYNVSYEEYFPKTPKDWALDFDYADKMGVESVHGRTLLLVQYEKNGVKYRVGLTDYYGIAGRVYSYYNTPQNKVVDFEILGSNFGEDIMIHHD